MVEYNDENEELEESESQDTAGYLCELCDFLSESDEIQYHKREILSGLETLEEDLDYLEQPYKKPAPKGGESMNALMVDIISHYKQSIEEICLFFEDEDKDRLKKSREMAMTAANLVTFMRNTIAGRRLEMAEILSKIEKGELKEGEPIPTDYQESFSIRDQDSVLERLRSLPKARDTSFLEDKA